MILIALLRINAYTYWVATSVLQIGGDHMSFSPSSERWELYRLLADPVRVRLLALASLEELGVGELAELLREGQPKISRHASALRDAGILLARRQGTWTLLRLAPGVERDPVVADALGAGRASCERDGTTARVHDILRARDSATREFFARGGRPTQMGTPIELPSYLTALRPLLPRHAIAVDAGTGDGALIEVLAPLFDCVIGIDRSEVQLELASDRMRRRGFANVELVQGELDGPEVRKAIDRALETTAGLDANAPDRRGADVVFASRVLHHAPIPSKAFASLVELADPRGGAVFVLDYEAHDDQGLRDREADLWLGFTSEELRGFARDAELNDVTVQPLPAAWRGEGPDRHLPWQILSGRRSTSTQPEKQ